MRVQATTMRRHTFGAVILVAALAAASFAIPAAADEVEVRIDNFVFNPAQLTVKPGTTVTCPVTICFWLSLVTRSAS